MKIKVEKNILKNAVAKVVKAVNQRTVVPVLTGMKLEAKDGALTLVGSDSDISITTKVNEEVIISEEGGIVIPAKKFDSIVKSLPDGDVQVEVKENTNVLIKAGKSRFNLNGVSVSEYPKLSLGNAVKLFTTDSTQLADTIKKTSFAVSKTETRPVLTGVNFSNVDGELVAIATDSHRLSKVKPGLDVGFEEDFTIPAQSLKEVPSLFNAGEVTVSKADNNIVIEGKEIIVMLRTLNNNYPDTSRLIPDNDHTIVKVSRKSFIESLERARVLSENDKIVKFVVSDENKGIFDTIQLKQNAQEVGLSVEDIVVNEIEGEEIEISFNVDYAIDALKAIEGEEVKFSFGGKVRPFTITDTNDKNDLQLILPVRTY